MDDHLWLDRKQQVMLCTGCDSIHDIIETYCKDCIAERRSFKLKLATLEDIPVILPAWVYEELSPVDIEKIKGE